MNGWKIVGVNDDHNKCEVCGKPELKKTVHLIHEDGGELRAGTTCAARKIGVKAKDMNSAVKSYNTRLQIARCHFPDYFRRTIGVTVEQHIRQYPHGRAQAEDLYRRYMRREGFTV